MELLHRLSFIQIFVMLFHLLIKRNQTPISQLFLTPDRPFQEQIICAATLVLSTLKKGPELIAVSHLIFCTVGSLDTVEKKKQHKYVLGEDKTKELLQKKKATTTIKQQ